MKKLHALNSQGTILLAIIIVLPVIFFITAAFLGLANTSLQVAQKDQQFTHAQLAVDAGIDQSMYEISQDEDWEGTSGEVELQNNNGVRTTYEASVADVSDEQKTITAIGRSYKPTNSTTPDSTVTILVDLRPVSSNSFSVVTGVGGLYMSNSAKILGGSVHVNGEVQMSNTAQIGLTTSPVTMTVAHQSCPVPATSAYPRLCNSGEHGQPITISNTAHIYGDVKANNQTSTTGMTNPGLTGSSGVASQELPTYDRDAQKAAVANNQTGAAAGCSGSTHKTWPANLKITGNVSVSNNCQITVSGNVWITGRLTMSNSSKLIVSNTLGSTRPVIMADGSGTAVSLSNTTDLQENSSGTGFEVITYWSSASCSPDCADVTGTDLSNSRNTTTIDMNNTAGATESILYARWSRVSLSNTGQIGALVGQTVQLSNSATITFGTSVGTGTTYWVINGYRRSFD